MALLICGCTQLEDLGDKIANKCIDTNINHKTPYTQTVASPTEQNTYKLNEDVIDESEGLWRIRYNIRSVNIYNSFKDAAINISSSNTFSVLDDYVDAKGIMQKNGFEQGELSDGFKFVLVDMNVTNLYRNINYTSDFNISDVELYISGDYNKYFEEIFTDESGAQFMVTLIPEGANYFSFKTSETATRSSKSSEFLHYSLAENETVSMQIGFIVYSEILDNYDMYLRIGSNLEDCQFVKLFE